MVALLACKERAAAPVPAPGPASAPPLMWRVERDGAVSWLLGTMHLGVSADDALPPAVWRRLAESSLFVMETDTSAIDREAALAMARGAHPSLREQLSPAQWQALVAALPEIPPATLAQL